MAHLAVEFPRDVAEGCQAILQRKSEIVTLASGREETNQRWAHSRRSWAAGLAVRSATDMQKVVALFEEARGVANSFHFRDWLDWRSAPPNRGIAATDCGLGNGDGQRTAFQLRKRYGAVNPYWRNITLPHPASVLVAVGGVVRPSGWTLAPWGQVVFDTAPAAGLAVTAGFTFDVAVRFESDALAVEWAYFREDHGGVASAPEITLLEVRLDG